MANYLITAPNGKKYRVTGQGSKEEAFQALQQRLGAPDPTAENARQDASAALPDVNIADARAQGEFDRLPVWQKPIVAADDIVTLMGNGASFGAVPWAAAHARALVKGTTYEDERAAMNEKLREAEARAGMAGAAADILGVVGSGAGLAKAGITAASLPKIGAKAALVLDNAALGAGTAVFNDQDAATGAALGAGLGVAGNALGGLVSRVLTRRAQKAMEASAPSFAAVKAEKDALYGALEKAGVKFDANSFAVAADDVANSVAGFTHRAPYASELASNLQAMRGTSPTFRQVEDILSQAKAITRDHTATPGDKAAAGKMVDTLSSYFDSAPLMTNGTIPANEVSSLAKQAREMARRHILARDVNEMERKADWYVSGRESGMRNQATSYGKRNGRSLSTMEEAALKRVTQREGLRDILQKSGNGLSQHVLPAVLGTAGMTGGLPGMAMGYGIGLGANKLARAVSGRSTDTATRRLVKTILAGRSAQRSAAAEAARQIAQFQRPLRLGIMGAVPLLAGEQ